MSNEVEIIFFIYITELYFLIISLSVCADNVENANGIAHKNAQSSVVNNNPKIAKEKIITNEEEYAALQKSHNSSSVGKINKEKTKRSEVQK